jgi:phosphatidylinositol-3,4,5-trisphosphate 3-phosphatase/dual-specificity protein phosphatase PTEN
MGWFWFIPAFHVSQDASLSPSTLVLVRKELDFPLGTGAKIIDVEVGLRPCPMEDARPESRDEKEDRDGVVNIPAELEAVMDADLTRATGIMQADSD